MLETANIYYNKGIIPFVPEKVEMKDYQLVCKYKIFRFPGHKDETILETLFGLFNWEEEGFQPTDREIGFDRGEAKHTAMSIGDLVEISGTTYICEAAGWKKVEV